MNQPVSQIPETSVGLRRETDAKAQANSVTAVKSGSSLQFTRHTSRQETYIFRIAPSGGNSITLSY
jgi:hypothetical protein